MEKLVGKTIKEVVQADGRYLFGDDDGWIMYFTDGSSLEVSAYTGQGCGCISEVYHPPKGK